MFLMPHFQACGWDTQAKIATSCAVKSRAGDSIRILLQSLYIRSYIVETLVVDRIAIYEKLVAQECATWLPR